MIAMYHNVDESLKGCSNSIDDEREGKRLEMPEKLLEERWFFDNLLDNKSKMLGTRNYTTTNTNTSTATIDDKENLHIGKSYEEIFQSIKSTSGSPSMPPCKEKNELISSSSKVVRAPSMPLGPVGDQEAEEDEEEEVEFSMGKLIRQASLNSTTKSMSLTSNHAPKSLTSSSSSNISRRKAEWDSRKLERMKPQRLMNQLKSQKSLSALECKQLRVIPEFQQKTRIREEKEEDDDDDNEEKNPIKAQIKFWARAVASNVRQE